MRFATLKAYAEMSWKAWVCSRQKLYSFGDATGLRPPCLNKFSKITILSGSVKANGFNRTVFTTEKIAVLVPMPSASAAITTMVNPGAWRNMRQECFRSFRKLSMLDLDEK